MDRCIQPTIGPTADNEALPCWAGGDVDSFEGGNSSSYRRTRPGSEESSRKTDV
ncbi:hypothetical protein [[Eubacterium] cellulosolvens]